MDDPCDFCPAFLSQDEIRVVDVMTDGDFVRPAAYIADEAQMPVDMVRDILRKLREIGIAVCGNLVSDEGRLAGRGTWLNNAGFHVQAALRAALNKTEEREIEKGWILLLGRIYPGDRRVLAWNWSYVFRCG